MLRALLAGIFASGVLLSAAGPAFAQDGAPPLTFNQPQVPPEFMRGGPAQPAYGQPPLPPPDSQQTGGAEWLRSGMPGETAFIPNNQWVSSGPGPAGCGIWEWNVC